MGARAHNIHRAAVIAVLLAVALGACAGNDDDSGASEAIDAAVASPEQVDGNSRGLLEDEAGGDATAGTVTAAEEAEAPAAAPAVLGDPLAVRDIAIEARATVATDDVRATVDAVTSAVTAQGGLIASASVDYAPDVALGPDARSQATIVARVPPPGLARLVDRLADLGTVTGFDQLAEDVTEQVADLDVRIANQRASVGRIRELLAEANDIDAVVRLESELTQREIELERLLAAERNLDERVALSTLTIDVIEADPAEFAASSKVDVDEPSVGDALSSGWDAFATAVFAVILVLAAAAPFIVFALGVAVVALTVRRLIVRRPRQAVGPPQAPLGADQEEPVSASRPG